MGRIDVEKQSIEEVISFMKEDYNSRIKKGENSDKALGKVFSDTAYVFGTSCMPIIGRYVLLKRAFIISIITFIIGFIIGFAAESVLIWKTFIN